MDAMKQSFRPISPVHTKAYTPISLFFKLVWYIRNLFSLSILISYELSFISIKPLKSTLIASIDILNVLDR